jgi:hypothetical protein
MTLLFQSVKSVKDKVILSLGDVWPLKPKEIWSYIKSHFDANVTFQAVYKAVNELIAGGVILKTGEGLMLDKEWVGSLKDYTHHIDLTYKNGSSKKNGTGSEQLTVDSIWDWYYHVLVAMERFAKDGYSTKVPMIIRGTHEWNAMVIGREELWRALSAIKKYDIYTVALVDNPIADNMMKYWERLGVKVARTTRSNFIDSTSDIVVIGDYVIQAMMPKELIEELQKFYEGTDSITKMDVARLQLDIFYKKVGIHVITVKNKDLADSLRRETLEFFEQEKLNRKG